MFRPLLTLALLAAQALSLVGAGLVLCREADGRVALEWAGEPCHCHDDAPPPAADPHAAPACECDHRPLAAGSVGPSLPPAFGTNDSPPTVAPPWPAATLLPPVTILADASYHDPPAAGNAHLALLSGVLLRC